MLGGDGDGGGSVGGGVGMGAVVREVALRDPALQGGDIRKHAMNEGQARQAARTVSQEKPGGGWMGGGRQHR